jgi:hypothetical protein
MAYTKDKEWLIDELTLLSSVLSSPASVCSGESSFERVGAYAGAHRAAVIILDGIIDAVKEDDDDRDI